MQVRVFESEDMNSALRMIKEALGPDALILSSRTVRKGGLGLFGKPVLEVTAAIDEAAASAARKPVAPTNSTPAPAPLAATAQKPRRTLATVDDNDLDYSQIWRRAPVIDGRLPIETPPNPTRPTDSPPAVAGTVEPLAALRGELDQLKQMVGQLVSDLPQRLEQLTRPPRPQFLPPQPAAPGSRATTAGSRRKNSGEHLIEQIQERLADCGVEEQTAATIAHYAVSQLAARQRPTGRQLDQLLHNCLCELIQTCGPLFAPGTEPRRLALIGPTGVGKTTTIAKLAAAYLLAGGKRVALVTIDTYRIAAVEQLKVYGEIMNVPVEVVMRPEQLATVLQRHANKELILIDTAGRSPKDDVSLQELREFLAVDSQLQAHLVLSATTRERDLYETFNRFSGLEPRSLLLTKLDECDSLGVLLNLQLRTNCPLSYLGNGQRVPEDLSLASATAVSELILGRHEEHADE